MPRDLVRRLRRIGLAGTLQLPARVSDFLTENFHQNSTEVSIYQQAIAATRALRAAGHDVGEDPLDGAPRAPRGRRQNRSRGIPRAAPAPESPSAGRRRRRGAARQKSRTDKASSKELGELLTASCFAEAGIGAPLSAVVQVSSSRVTAVSSGQAYVVHGSQKPCVTWVALVDDSPLFLCSCSGRRESESFVVRMKLHKSSSCKHAAGLRIAHNRLATALSLVDLPSLYGTHPALASEKGAVAAQPEAAFIASKPQDGALYAAVVDSVWAVVEKPGKNAVSQAVFCHYPPCRSKSRRCGHALTVNPRQAEPDDADLVKDLEGAEEAAAKELADRLAASPFRDVDVPRRSRNLLPCSEEVRLCSEWGDIAKRRTEGAPLPGIPLHEPHCLVHTDESAPPLVDCKIQRADVITLDGFLSFDTAQWTCSSCSPVNNKVPYDGAADGLFAVSGQTLFTRTFLDVALHITLTTRSSIAAAAAVMAFGMHCNSALGAMEVGVVRQLITNATELYARTLVVPGHSYHCSRCYGSPKRPYTHVITDGQTIAPFKRNTHPFVRDTANCPTVPINVSEASAAKAAGVRRIVRKRVKDKWNEATSVAPRDLAALMRLKRATIDAPPVDDLRANRASTAEWAGSYLLSSFFQLGARTAKDVVSDGDTSTDDEVDGPSGNGADQDGGAEGAAEDGSDASSTEGTDEADGSNATVRDWRGKAVLRCVDGVVGSAAEPASVLRDRWAHVRVFFRTFLAEPVVGVFGGCDEAGVKRLARSLIRCSPQKEWLRLTRCIQGVNVVWPFLMLVSDLLDIDELLCRAVGELLMFAVETDLHVELLWNKKAKADSLAFKKQWEVTDAAKFRAWAAREGHDPRSGLVAHPSSARRALRQAREVASGHVWPFLDQVRPYPRDDPAAAARRRQRSAKAKKGRSTTKQKRKTRAKERKTIGDDDCRHEFRKSAVFAPGVVSFLCSCGVLLGFEVLEQVESPAGIVSSLAARFPLLPHVVYFDTACQAARNATRRMPWLVRMSRTSWALDRFHASAHVCSPIFDANMYPDRSMGHKTSAAENRHSLNKPLKNHLSYLGQDRFVVQMRLHGAFNNLRIKFRRRLSRTRKTLAEIGHRPLSPFFHAFIAKHCERVGCHCRDSMLDVGRATPPSSQSNSSSGASSGYSTPSWHSDEWGTSSSSGDGSSEQGGGYGSDEGGGGDYSSEQGGAGINNSEQGRGGDYNYKQGESSDIGADSSFTGSIDNVLEGVALG